jgi:hypothetical protein
LLCAALCCALDAVKGATRVRPEWAAADVEAGVVRTVRAAAAVFKPAKAPLPAAAAAAQHLTPNGAAAADDASLALNLVGFGEIVGTDDMAADAEGELASLERDDLSALVESAGHRPLAPDARQESLVMAAAAALRAHRDAAATEEAAAASQTGVGLVGWGEGARAKQLLGSAWACEVMAEALLPLVAQRTSQLFPKAPGEGGSGVGFLGPEQALLRSQAKCLSFRAHALRVADLRRTVFRGWTPQAFRANRPIRRPLQASPPSPSAWAWVAAAVPPYVVEVMRTLAAARAELDAGLFGQLVGSVMAAVASAAAYRLDAPPPPLPAAAEVGASAEPSALAKVARLITRDFEVAGLPALRITGDRGGDDDAWLGPDEASVRAAEVAFFATHIGGFVALAGQVASLTAFDSEHPAASTFSSDRRNADRHPQHWRIEGKKI